MIYQGEHPQDGVAKPRNENAVRYSSHTLDSRFLSNAGAYLRNKTELAQARAAFHKVRKLLFLIKGCQVLLRHVSQGLCFCNIGLFDPRVVPERLHVTLNVTRLQVRRSSTLESCPDPPTAL